MKLMRIRIGTIFSSLKKQGSLANWEGGYTEEEETENLRYDIESAIHNWTIQVINGKAYTAVDNKYTEVVYPIVKDICDRLFEKHEIKIRNKAGKVN
jgi:hypothetical protein